MPRADLEPHRRLARRRSSSRPLDLLASTTHPSRALRAGKAGLGLAALLAGLALWILARQVIRVSVVDFPSATGSNVLRMTRLSVGPWFTAESYVQPASLSYWAGTSFHWPQAQGGELACQAGIKGWARPQARRGTLLRFVCSCEQPRLHDRQPVSCWQAALSGRP